ncbi:MAG: hypothetical protein IKY70_01110 [Bacteroidales bacterium]|nr:hypothetical protein [Bacteroidales bacterium]
MKWKILSLLMCGFLFVGCSQYKQIDVDDIKIAKIKMNSAKEIDLKFGITVENPSRTLFTLQAIDGVIYRNGAEFANMVLLEEVQVPARFSGDVQAMCRLTLTDPLAALALGLNLASLNNDSFTVDVVATVKGGAVKKSFRYKDIPLSDVIKKFGIKL